MATIPFKLPQAEIAAFCKRWRIVELAIFGSAATGNFGPNSDLDLLVAFSPDADWSLLDQVKMEAELSALLDKPVDLVSRRAIEHSQNPIRKREILSGAQTIYAA